MSGVEVAGLVLGAFPVLMKCLNHYREGFEPLEEWWNFRTDFIAFVDDIRHQMMRYQENMTRLLDPIVTDTESLIALIQDAKDPRWTDSSLVISMQRRLGGEHGRFFRIIHRMEGVVADLKRLLRIKDDHVRWIESRDQRPWEWHMKRIRISFSKGKNKKVKKLESHNQQLQDILGYSERIIPLADSRKLSDPVLRYEKVRQGACGVYNALRQSWKCPGRSCGPHQAHLKLCAEPKGTDLNMLFFIPVRDKAEYIPRGVVIEPPEYNSKSSATAIEQINYVQQAQDFTAMQERFCDKDIPQKGSALRGFFSRTSKNIQPAPSSVSEKTKVSSKHGKRVHFIAPTPTAALSRDTHAHSPSPAITGSRKPSPRCIADLCSSLRYTRSICTLGTIADEFDREFTLRTKTQMRDYESPTRIRIVSEPTGLVSLPDILDRFHQARINIARHRRFKMAAHIASTLLQIQASPWLSRSWSKHDFFFHADSENLLSSRPHLSQSFLSKITDPPNDTSFSDISEDDTRASLFSIGVIILELIFGHNIESCNFRHLYYGANNLPNDQTDISTARKWAQKVLGECGIEIADVVRRCLDCSFGPRPSFRDKRFREAVYEGVIGPLVNYLKMWQVVMP